MTRVLQRFRKVCIVQRDVARMRNIGSNTPYSWLSRKEAGNGLASQEVTAPDVLLLYDPPHHVPAKLFALPVRIR